MRHTHVTARQAYSDERDMKGRVLITQADIGRQGQGQSTACCGPVNRGDDGLWKSPHFKREAPKIFLSVVDRYDAIGRSDGVLAVQVQTGAKPSTLARQHQHACGAVLSDLG